MDNETMIQEMDYSPMELFEQLKTDESIDLPKEEVEFLADLIPIMIGM